MKSQCWKGNCHTKGGDFETVSRKPQHSWECRGNLGIKSYHGVKKQKKTNWYHISIDLFGWYAILDKCNEYELNVCV